MSHLTESVNVHLNFVLIVLQSPKNCEHRSYSDVFLGKPALEIILTLASSSHHSCTIVVKPEDASHHTCRVINAKEESILLSDLEDDGTCDGHLGDQEVIPQNEENLARVLIVLPLILMVKGFFISIFDTFIHAL